MSFDKSTNTWSDSLGSWRDGQWPGVVYVGNNHPLVGVVMDDVVITEKNHIFYYTKPIVPESEQRMRLNIIRFLDESFPNNTPHMIRTGSQKWAFRMFGLDKKSRFVFVVYKPESGDYDYKEVAEVDTLGWELMAK